MSLAQPGTASRIDGARARYQAHGATASPGRSVVLLYDRLLRDLDDATVAIGGGKVAAAHEALIHAQKIVDGLDLCLDRDAWGGATALGMVYEYLSRELTAANVSKDRRRIAECRRIVEPLADAWRAAWAETAEGGVIDAPSVWAEHLEAVARCAADGTAPPAPPPGALPVSLANRAREVLAQLRAAEAGVEADLQRVQGELRQAAAARRRHASAAVRPATLDTVA